MPPPLEKGAQDHSIGESLYKRYKSCSKGLYNLLYSPVANNVTIADNITTRYSTTNCVISTYKIANNFSNLTKNKNRITLDN